jgi:peroxiredoxin Q/BCP
MCDGVVTGKHTSLTLLKMEITMSRLRAAPFQGIHREERTMIVHALRRRAFHALLAMALPALALVSLFLASPAARAEDPAPAAGQPAPAFKLQDQAGKWHSLSDYKGKWVALYFYPKDDTPGCTTQACSFRDNVFAFNKEGAVILGVSVDDVESHKAFAEKHGLPFTLLADADKSVTKRYGVLRNYGVMEVARRDTFIIDPQGRIAKHYESVKPDGHSALVLADIKALKAEQAKAGKTGG